MSTKDSHFSRRDFLRHTVIGTVGVGMSLSGLNSLQTAIGSDELPSLPHSKSKVIAVKNSGIMSGGKPDQKFVQNMVNEGMFTLTGKKPLQRHGVHSLPQKMLWGSRSTQSEGKNFLRDQKWSIRLSSV